MPGARPETAAETETDPVPEPASFVGVVEPYAVLVPYSKCQLVAWPLGTTLPRSVAADDETPLADEVVAPGTAPSEMVWSPPVAVPASLVATRRKW